MKKTIFLALIFMFVFVPTVSAEERIYFYLDGQEQRYDGDVVVIDRQLFLPLRPLLLNLQYVDETWAIDRRLVAECLRDVYKGDLENCTLFEIVPPLDDVDIRFIDRRAMISLDDAKRLGYDVYFFEKEKILHVNTANLHELAGLRIGESMDVVAEKFPDVDWNTAFGQPADYVGFIGANVPYTYVDRYGYVRKGEVPEVQVEIRDGNISYIFVSSDRFPTSKRVKVGDHLRDVFQAYGSQFVRDEVDGKQIVVYDVEFGSIWFIANNEQIIERIAYWDHHLKGFGKDAIRDETMSRS